MNYGQKQSIASLHPTHPIELNWKVPKNDNLFGSHLLLLRRVHRLPESSRNYIHGDPVHLIDWKAYSRTDELIVREIQDPAQAKVEIFINASDDMAWPTESIGHDGVHVSKLEVAWRIGLNLAHIHTRMGDAVRFEVYRNKRSKDHQFETVSSTSILELFDGLERSRFRMEESQLPGSVVSSFPRQSDLVYCLTDGIDSYLPKSALKAKRGVYFHTLHSLELDDSWMHPETSYFDGDLGQREYLGNFLREQSRYKQAIQVWSKKISDHQQKRGWQYLCVSEKTKLSNYFDFIGLQTLQTSEG